VVVFFFGRRLKNFKTAAAGLVLHLAAAVAFAAERDVFAYGDGAFRGARFIGSLVIALAARSVHFYGGVPYGRVFDSGVFHFCLFILWAVYGIGHIIGGSKWSWRKVWIAGAVLTVVDVAKLLILDLAGTGAVTRIISFFIAGLLLLFIGWAAPLPPPEGKEQAPSPDSGENHEP
jgi:hypothetical protein